MVQLPCRVLSRVGDWTDEVKGGSKGLPGLENPHRSQKFTLFQATLA